MPEHPGSLVQSPSPKLGRHWFSESYAPVVTSNNTPSPGPLLTAILHGCYSCAHSVDETIEVLGD